MKERLNMFKNKSNSDSFSTNLLMQLIVLLEQKKLVNRGEIMNCMYNAVNETAEQQAKQDEKAFKELSKEVGGTC